MGDCSHLEYPETMKKIAISLALLLTNSVLGTAAAHGTEVPPEVREAFRSWKMPDVEAFRALERAVADAGKAIEAAVPIPDLTVDLKGRRLSKHLGGSDLWGRGRLDFDADYRIGGAPTAKLALRGRLATLRASYDANGAAATALVVPLGSRQNLEYALNRGARVDHRVSWNFSLPL
jgi:hypothetical protein